MDRALHVNLENEPVLRQATEWVLELQSPGVSTERIAEWERWLAADERHVRAFDRVAALWSAADDIRAIGLPSEAEVANDAYDGSLSVSAWKWRMDTTSAKRSDVAPRTEPWPPSGRRYWVAAGLAACTLIGIATLLGIYPRELSIPGFASFHRIDTKAGETRKVTLADGSIVSVGGASSLWVRLTPRARTVSLGRGEAFFEVAQDAQRPFTVHAGATSVTAVGTAFNVRRAGKRVVVAVAEGVVNVDTSTFASPPDAPADLGSAVIRSARLSAGQQLSVDPAHALPVAVSVDSAAVAGWRDGRLQYLNEPLENIVSDIRRYAARDIEIADPRIAELQVTGTVFEQNLDVWLMSLETMFPVRIVREPDGKVRLQAAE